MKFLSKFSLEIPWDFSLKIDSRKKVRATFDRNSYKILIEIFTWNSLQFILKSHGREKVCDIIE